MAKTVKVQIYDQTYQVQGDFEDAYVAGLAQDVDQRMRVIAQATGMVDSVRVAVLTALNIADELHSLRQRQTELEGEVRQRTERALGLVEQALKQTA